MKNILIVDDSPAERQNLEEIISDLVCRKCKIHSASDGLEGIKKAQIVKPDIVFLDVIMPMLNGYAAAVRIRHTKGLEHTVIIAITSQSESDVEKKMTAVCDDFISKPVTREKVSAVLEKYMKEDLRKSERKKLGNYHPLTGQIVDELVERVNQLSKVNEELERKNELIESLYLEAEHAKKKLEALINFRQDFLNFIFHEIKGPLSSILGFSELLQMRYFADLGFEGNRYVESILTSAERIKKLMDQVARFNAFEFEIKGNEYVRVEKAVDEVLLRYNDFISEKELKVQTDYAKGCKIQINRDYLIEILDSLIRNAIIYNKTNGIIEIKCEKSDGTVEIAIKDTGIGMSETQLKQAFVPFMQFIDVEHYKTHKLKGLGLGLSICKKMVEMAGGEIRIKRIKSEKNKGTEVIISLPEKL